MTFSPYPGPTFRKPLGDPACRSALLLAALLLLAAPLPAAPTTQPGVRSVGQRLAELDFMIRSKWWDLARKEHASIEQTLKALGSGNPIIQQQMATARQAIESEAAEREQDPEYTRPADVIKRVKSFEPKFPDKYRVIRVKPDGPGPSRALADALFRSDDRDVIELYTGVYTLSPGIVAAPNHSAILYAARGEWPRIVPAPEAEFTFQHRRWLDGLEIVPAPRGIGEGTLELRNCYLRAEAPTTSPDAGPAGAVAADSIARDTVFRNLTTALSPAKDDRVAYNLFITCVTGVARSQDRFTVDHCAFYRCLTAISGPNVDAEFCLFSRCRNEAAEPARRNCLTRGDPFVDPFRGDFRVKPDVRLPSKDKDKDTHVGPRWSAERWELFMANANLPLASPPLSLAQARDPEAQLALGELRKAVSARDWQATAAALTPLLDRLAACPSARQAAGEIDSAVATVLTEATRGSVAVATAPEAPASPAADAYRQAAEAVAAARKDDALAAAKRAAEADAAHVPARQLAAELLMDAGRPTQAEPFLKAANDLLEASRQADPEVRNRQVQLTGRLTPMLRLCQEWRKLLREWASRYDDLAASFGPPSAALALRRSAMLAPEIQRYPKRLAIAESMVVPLAPRGPTDPAKAKEARNQAEEQLAQRQYNKAVELRRQAFDMDPAPEDLLFLSRCYQRLVQVAYAAVLAVQGKQQAAALADPARSRRLVADATELLRQLDPPIISIERMDQELLGVADLKGRMAEVAGVKEITESIAEIRARLQCIDVLQPNAAASQPANP